MPHAVVGAFSLYAVLAWRSVLGLASVPVGIRQRRTARSLAAGPPPGRRCWHRPTRGRRSLACRWAAAGWARAATGWATAAAARATAAAEAVATPGRSSWRPSALAAARAISCQLPRPDLVGPRRRKGSSWCRNASTSMQRTSHLSCTCSHSPAS
eukprot:scaffold31776_cov73-Phaeocystis_antarctica.AAC.5